MMRTLTSEQKAELIEELADIEHKQWMKWSSALENEMEQYSDWLPEDLAILLSKRLARWNSLWIPYRELTEETKELDRVWARKVLQKIEELNMEILSK